jgi:hypothetical protein
MTKKLLREEPVAVTAFFQAIIGLGIAFGWWHWSPAETGAVIALAAGTLTLIRGVVVPTARQQRISPPAGQQPAAATGATVAVS